MGKIIARRVPRSLPVGSGFVLVIANAADHTTLAAQRGRKTLTVSGAIRSLVGKQWICVAHQMWRRYSSIFYLGRHSRHFALPAILYRAGISGVR
jgi:hypothetical protein